jgi:uncharacterized integral membrane protein (TIGR00698 family)
VAELTVAVVLGLGLAQVAGARAAVLDPGIGFAIQRLLRAGIVLLGARLDLAEIARIGVPALVVIVVTMTAAFGLVLTISRLVRIEGRLAILLAVGSAVCGNSAIVATAPVIGAAARSVAYAVATITLFGTAAVIVYPLVGHALGMGDAAFGLWAGIAVNDTSQVVATGAAYSPAALDVATVVKLIRNAMMAPLLLLIAVLWSRGSGAPADAGAGLRKAVPLFVLGFLLMAALRTAGLIGPDLAGVLDAISRVLILVALAGVGLSIRVAELRATSWRPIAVGLMVAIGIGAGTLAAILALGLADGLAR